MHEDVRKTGRELAMALIGAIEGKAVAHRASAVGSPHEPKAVAREPMLKSVKQLEAVGRGS